MARAILERLRADGFAGATVVHGVAGFGANSVIHTASLVELSADLPVVIEVVEDEAHVDRLLPILDQMITGGALVTVERVRVVKYAARTERLEANLAVLGNACHPHPQVRAVPQYTQGTMRFVVRAYCA